MSRLFNILSQSLSVITASNVAVFVEDHVLANRIIVGIGIVQAIVSVIAHAYNPDGTKAEAAYIKPEKP